MLKNVLKLQNHMKTNQNNLISFLCFLVIKILLHFLND